MEGMVIFMRKNTISHIVVLFAGTFFNVVIGIITTPIITRLVSPDSYGQLSIFNLYENIIVMVVCIGLDQALIRFYYREQTMIYKKNLIRQCTLMPFLIAVALGGASILLYSNSLFSFEFGLCGLVLLVICSVVQLIRRFSFIVLRLEYRSNVYSILHIAQKIIYVICVVLLLYFVEDYDFELLVVGTIISVFLVTAASIVSTKKLWSFTSTSKTVISRKELFSFGIPFILSMGITTVFQAIDQFSIKYFCDFYETGIYSSAMSIIHIFALVQTTFNAFWGPLSTEHYQNNQEENKDFYVKANDYVCIIMFIMGISLIMFKDILAFLLGSEYRLAVYIIPCLVFSPLMQTISETTSVGINYSQKSYLHIIVSLIACVVNILGNICLVPLFGGKGAAISTGIAYIVFFIFRTLFSAKYFKIALKYKKIVILGTMLLLYAMYNTFSTVSIWSFVGGVICILIWFVVYKNEINLMLKDVMIFIKMKLGTKRSEE